MCGFLFILLFLLIYIEAIIFVRFAESNGVLMALILMFLTSYFGFFLIKNHGIKSLLLIHQKLSSRENLTEDMIRNIAIFISSALLILPGFITDFGGLLLLLSPIQKIIVTKFIPYIKCYSIWGENNNFNHYTKGQTYEGELDKKSNSTINIIKDLDDFKKENKE